MPLDWPGETVLSVAPTEKWEQPASNIVLDFHGDPLKAKLVVFSDGNHHMALLQALQAFHAANPSVEDIFYATTPPGPIASMLKSGVLYVGNLALSIKPHVFISPPHILEQLKSSGLVDSHRMLARNRGSVLLIRKGNPKVIADIKDLMREDVRLFISNPETESVSYHGYRQTLEEMAVDLGLGAEEFAGRVFDRTAVRGRRIHHREAPEAVAAGIADAAIVYYHLALRYCRIFPDIFEFVFLRGRKDNLETHPHKQTAAIHIGLVGEGGDWGGRFLDFMLSRTVADIYTENGLLV